MIRLRPFLLLISSLLLAPAASWALGTRVTDQNAEATARGGAFAATADNPSAIYYNPAGITQLEGTRALLGGYAVALKTRVSLDDPDRTSFSSTNTELQPAPQFYVTWKPANQPFALGLGVYASFGFAMEYPDDTPFRTLAHKSKLQYLTINPVFAFQLTRDLSVAVGPTINYGRAELEQGVLVPGDHFRFEGDGVSYGFTAGLLWTPHPQHRFGFTYRSATKLDFDGHSNLQYDDFEVATPFGPFSVPGVSRREAVHSENFDFPQVFTLGYAFTPTPDWNFEFDLDWTDWDSLNTVTLKQKSGDIAIPFNYRSSFMYDFGVTKKFAGGWQVNAGYIYSENSVPNESYNPIVPDSDRHVFSIGIGRKLEHFDWLLAYQYAYGPRRHIDNGTLANGNYRFESNALTLSIGYRF